VKKVVVYYTEENGALDDRLIPVDMNGDGKDESPDKVANDIALMMQQVWQLYASWGLPDPLGLSEFNIIIYDVPERGVAGWCCDYLGGGQSSRAAFILDAPIVLSRYRSNRGIFNMELIAHELFHAVQRAKRAPILPSFFREGTASFMMDVVNLEIDKDSSSLFIGHVRPYFEGQAFRSLEWSENRYAAALFWKYFAEQIGTPLTDSEPAYGIDAIGLLLDKLENYNNNVFGVVGEMVRDHDGRDLESFWSDFTVANYLTFTGGYPNEFCYPDAEQTAYPAMQLDLKEPIGLFRPIAVGEDYLEPWAACYYRIQPDRDVREVHFDFRQYTDNEVGYTLVFNGYQYLGSRQEIGQHFFANSANRPLQS